MTDDFQVRGIWFWQEGRYLRDGWSINKCVAIWSDPLSWLDALEDLIRPRAVRSEATRRQLAESGGSGG